MKLMLRLNSAGKLLAYVAKKDLEEEVVNQTIDANGGRIFTLANGWELAIANLADPLALPQTVEARRLA
jgi:nitrogen fixation protein NifT